MAELYEDVEEMSDEELAEEYKSFFLQMENGLPRFLDEEKRMRQLSKEVNERDNIEVLKSVRVLKQNKAGEDIEVLAE